MFPIVEQRNVSNIVLALEEHQGVFIKSPELSKLGKETFLAAKEVFDSNQPLPELDVKTMFPSTIGTLPGAQRRVIQKYLVRPLSIDNERLSLQITNLSYGVGFLAEDILEAAGVYYEWDAHIMDSLYNIEEWTLNIANYPFTKEREGQLLFPAHKDWGLMAIYPYVDGEGLEVYIDGQWQSLALPEDCLLCYVGDIYTRLSEGKTKSLLHRVKQPGNKAPDRTSTIFYIDPIRSMVLPDGTTVESLIDSKLKKIGQIK